MKKIFSILCCAILFCSFMITPCLAATHSYPSISDIVNEISAYNHYGYFIYTRSGNYYLVSFRSNADDNYFFRLLVENDSIKLQLPDKNLSGGQATYTYTVYQSVDGSWSRIDGKSNATWETVSNTSYEHIVSTIDIKHKDGTIFFQATPMEMTLSEMIQMVVAQEIPALRTILGQQMMTIVLCGVGCLALLITLPILLKVLRRFLV